MVFPMANEEMSQVESPEEAEADYSLFKRVTSFFVDPSVEEREELSQIESPEQAETDYSLFNPGPRKTVIYWIFGFIFGFLVYFLGFWPYF